MKTKKAESFPLGADLGKRWREMIPRQLGWSVNNVKSYICPSLVRQLCCERFHTDRLAATSRLTSDWVVWSWLYSLLEQLLSSDLTEQNRLFFWPLTLRTASEDEDGGEPTDLRLPTLAGGWTPRSLALPSADLPFDLSGLEVGSGLREAASELSCESESARSRSDASCSCSHTWLRFSFRACGSEEEER